MSEDKKQMDSAIKKILVPILREKNFKGTFPHFFREINGHIDLLTFQFNRYGGSFVVEISYADNKRKNVYIHKDLPPGKLRSNQTTDRLRLGSKPQQGKSDHWFQYDKKNFFSRGNIFENVAKEVIPFLEDQAEEWWRSKYIS
ncbi:DUF4304 domain-containing protein [Patescibacteria group bacterium]